MTAIIDAQDDYDVDNQQTVLLQTATSKIVVDQGMHQLIQKRISIRKYGCENRSAFTSSRQSGCHGDH
ncbi:hypothetical protein OL548_10970 [Lysinibacillus sp. MHQ-1]|nr:hypothetical protein OL548_10970 [Lysinibacillus sp. MHQ-1]